jgi:hypothetical protein
MGRSVSEGGRCCDDLVRPNVRRRLIWHTIGLKFDVYLTAESLNVVSNEELSIDCVTSVISPVNFDVSSIYWSTAGPISCKPEVRTGSLNPNLYSPSLCHSKMYYGTLACFCGGHSLCRPFGILYILVLYHHLETISTHDQYSIVVLTLQMVLY